LSISLDFRRLVPALVLIVTGFALACPSATRSPGPDSYAVEGNAEAMEDEMAEEAWDDTER
jgi:hypothetical protein